MKTARFAILLLLALLVAGCVTTQTPHATADGDQVVANFRVQGRIAVHGVSDAFSASFDWRQAGERYDIELWGMLGLGRARLSGDGAAVTVTDARGRARHDVRPEALLRRELGWSAPLGALRYWVLGQHDPAAAVRAERHDAAGRRAEFEQFGWTVALSRWRAGDGPNVPAKIVATQGDNRVAIVCEEWWIGD